jgi:signal transduction histidine kinase
MAWPGNPSTTWLQQASGRGGIEHASLKSQILPLVRARRWPRWLIGAVLGGLMVWVLALALVRAPVVNAHWHRTMQGQLEWISSPDARLQSHVGKILKSWTLPNQVVATSPHLLQHSARWMVADAERAAQQAAQIQLAAMFAQPLIQLQFTDGSRVDLPPQVRGWSGLPVLFWMLCVCAIALCSVGLALPLIRPSVRNAAYAVMACCQAGNLLLMGAEATLQLGLSAPLLSWGLWAHTGLDLFTAAAIVHATTLSPRRLPGARWIALWAWLLASVVLMGCVTGQFSHVWWWTQTTVLGMGLIAIALMSWSHHIEPHPYAIGLRRFGIVIGATWSLLTVAVALAHGFPNPSNSLADMGAMVWYLFLSALLLLLPFLAKSRHSMRELSLLAATCTVTTSINIVLMAAFSLGPFAALTLSLFVSLVVYSAARCWILDRLMGSNMLTNEHMFERLHRLTRAIEAQPERSATLLQELLGDLFDPLEIALTTPCQAASNRVRVTSDGATMLVPVALLHTDADTQHAPCVNIRFAQRGKRLFTPEDVRLTHRILDQLRHAVHFDKAVEQGRSDERIRLAQDLHDDIGARLLTLMYNLAQQAPELEDYARHTLQDLKTLTRGLAATNHRLSHAAAEWKADLAHRAAAASIELKSNFEFDEDVVLSVVQWSALTRILRELVSNASAHARATRVDIQFCLHNDQVDLSVTDNGAGRNPSNWSNGLGVGGVRKRAKQLGGEVVWQEAEPGGICCTLLIRSLSASIKLN